MLSRLWKRNRALRNVKISIRYVFFSFQNYELIQCFSVTNLACELQTVAKELVSHMFLSVPSVIFLIRYFYIFNSHMHRAKKVLCSACGLEKPP
jgi:hypothetical protein